MLKPSLLLTAILFLSSCSSLKAANLEDKPIVNQPIAEHSFQHATPPLDFNLPFTTPTVELEDIHFEQRSFNGKCTVNVNYPQFRHSIYFSKLSAINEKIKAAFLQSSIDYLQPFDVQKCEAKTNQNSRILSLKEEINYTITLNKNSILSLRYSSSVQQTQKSPAQPTLLYYSPSKALTINLETGAFYQFQDLFKPGSNYQDKLHSLIVQKLQAAYDISEQDLIGGRQAQRAFKDYSFYLTEESLVITGLFPTKALAAVQVKISPAEIQEFINPDGPLKALL